MGDGVPSGTAAQSIARPTRPARQPAVPTADVTGIRQTRGMPKPASTARLRAARLDAHGLRTGLSSITAAVRRLGAVQAQDFAAARWVLGARVPGSVSADVDAAIESREIVRSWPMRGTLHLLPTETLRPILEITGPRIMQRAATRHRQLELDRDVYARARELAEAALAGGASLSREELFAAWESAGIRHDRAAGLPPHLVARAGRGGLLRPRRGSRAALRAARRVGAGDRPAPRPRRDAGEPLSSPTPRATARSPCATSPGGADSRSPTRARRSPPPATRSRPSTTSTSSQRMPVGPPIPHRPRRARHAGSRSPPSTSTSSGTRIAATSAIRSMRRGSCPASTGCSSPSS